MFGISSPRSHALRRSRRALDLVVSRARCAAAGKSGAARS